jgi:hypothetical protein
MQTANTAGTGTTEQGAGTTAATGTTDQGTGTEQTAGTAAATGETLLTTEAAAGDEEGEQGTEGTEQTEQQTATGAPEQYAEFTLPENMTINAPVLDGMKELFKGLNLSQEQAQKAVQWYAETVLPDISATLEQARATTVNTWIEAVKSDPILGGSKLGQSLATAQKLIKEYPGQVEFMKMLNETGTGNHPEMIRFLHHYGSAMQEDRELIGNRGGGRKVISQAEFDAKSPKDRAAIMKQGYTIE